MQNNLQPLQEQLDRVIPYFQTLISTMHQVIVGQDHLIRSLVMALLADGHILLEGVPGLAKTLSISTLAKALEAHFKRIQFTPDLLPADLIGTRIYNPQSNTFDIKQGPIFTNLLLADEINRAPAKVQSALLEAMQERQVTIGQDTFKLEDPFLVMATQNPLEQEGTYPLPEAQLDRFMLKVVVEYPTPEQELQILSQTQARVKQQIQPALNASDLLAARQLLQEVYMDEKLKRYIVDLIFATREPEKYKLDLRRLLRYGASPRATIYLALCARVHAFLEGRAFVIPEDVKACAPDVLRHRLAVTYEAEAEDVTPAQLVKQILDQVKVP